MSRASAVTIVLLLAAMRALGADDLEWQAPFEPRLAAPPIVAAAPPCRAIQAGAQAEPDAPTSVALVRRPPSLERVVGGGRDECEAADPYRDVPRPLALVEGRVRLRDAALPADTECFDVVVEQGCAVVSTRLDALVPAREPGRVVAVLDAANAGALPTIAAGLGLRVLSSVRLRATAELLATFALSSGQAVDATVGLLAADGRVASAQPDYRYATASLHSDPLAALTYGPEKTGAVRLHPVSTGKGVVVAIVDTGVDEKNAELDGRIVTHVDLTGDGFSPDLHGTAIAGIVAANADNGVGSYGAAPGAAVVALKACAPLEPGKLAARCWTSTLVAALDEAIARDARIVNMSLAGPPDPLVARYVALARSQGRVIVAAAGNDGPLAKPAFPAALPGVIAVTAIDAADRALPSANEGDYVALAAPGVDVLSPAPDGTFPPLSGTSMAAAHTAGVVALLLELAPSASPEQIRAALVEDARPLGEGRRFGAGALDACAAAERLASAARCVAAP